MDISKIRSVLCREKESFVCDVRLLIRQKQISAGGKRFRKRATMLGGAKQCLDLDRLPNLPRYERRLICVRVTVAAAASHIGRNSGAPASGQDDRRNSETETRGNAARTARKLSEVQQLIPLFQGTDGTFVRYLTWHRESGGIGVELWCRTV